MEQILISACLVGQPVRHDGTSRRRNDRLLAIWQAEGRLVPHCPEVAGGLPVPRPPAEIAEEYDGEAVLDGRARVRTKDGVDVSRFFLAGARRALVTARRHRIRLAVLKEGSPSCGTHRIHDGTFQGRLAPGRGVTAALLERHGIRVFSEEELPAAAAYLELLEGQASRP